MLAVILMAGTEQDKPSQSYGGKTVKDIQLYRELIGCFIERRSWTYFVLQKYQKAECRKMA